MSTSEKIIIIAVIMMGIPIVGVGFWMLIELFLLLPLIAFMGGCLFVLGIITFFVGMYIRDCELT